MKAKIPSVFKLLLGAAFASVLTVGVAHAQSLQPNQTLGFAKGKIVTFTYQQSFDCVDQPLDDLDYNGVAAQSDSGEFQTPICQAGIQPSVGPTGNAILDAAGNLKEDTPVLFVLVPMFSVDNDQNPNDAIPCPPEVRLSTLCGPALGKTLIQLFGAIPEGYKAHPLVYTDCPNPGSPPGTCTMHASTVDLGAVLVALGKLKPPVTNVFLPTPNHSHVILNRLANTKAIWWEVVPVLITNPADWPTKDGSSGITSVAELIAAGKKGDAIGVRSNFFLFFSSQTMPGM